MNKFIFKLVVLIFMVFLFFTPKSVNAQFQLGLMGNYGIVGGNNPICLDIHLWGTNLAFGWNLKSNDDPGELYFHFGGHWDVIGAGFGNFGISIYSGLQAFFNVNEETPDLGIRLPIELVLLFGSDYSFRTFLGFNPAFAIIKDGSLATWDNTFQFWLSFGFRIYLYASTHYD